MARSPLQPFVVRVNRQPAVSSNSLQHADKHLGQNDVDGQIDDLDAIDTDETNQAVGQGQSSTDVQAAAVALTFKPDPGAVNAEQIADVVQVRASMLAGVLVCVDIACKLDKQSWTVYIPSAICTRPEIHAAPLLKLYQQSKANHALSCPRLLNRNGYQGSVLGNTILIASSRQGR